MRNKILLALLATTAVAMAAPAVATATLGTPIPDLPSGVDQAYLADSDGNPTSGSVTLTGQLNLVGVLTITCSTHLVMDYSDDGTTAVTSFTASNCWVAGVHTPRCEITIAAQNLDWGDRFGYSTSDSTFRDYINVHFDMTLANTPPQLPCPVTGTFTHHGTLYPTLSISGSTLSATFGSGSGSVTSPLGTATVAGTLSGTLPSGTQLVL